MVLHTLGKDSLHSFILEPHCLGYQLFPCQEPSKNGTDGKREDSGTIRQKMAFFTNLSNELKTPLSRIIAPVSQLLPAAEEVHEKQTLEEVQRNAMKINSLIHRY